VNVKVESSQHQVNVTVKEVTAKSTLSYS